MTRELLFIDDIPEDAELACWHLGKAGIACDYRVVETEAGLRAAFGEGLPDLILCDIVLPQFDGWDALRICRQVASAVPFVIYSGTVSVQDARLAMQRGVFASVEKDLTADLIAVVRRALGIP
jgi:CheY-like chemotaxis protein